MTKQTKPVKKTAKAKKTPTVKKTVAARKPRKKKTNGPLYSGTGAQDKEWKIYHGDASKILRQEVEANSIDCVVTSPPYFWLRDYGYKEQIGLEDSVNEYIKRLMQVMDGVNKVLKPSGLLFLNIGDTYYSGKGESQGVDKKSKKRRFGLRAVDKSGGMGIGLKPKTLIGIPLRLATQMVTKGWVLRSTIIWYRKFALPESVQDRPGRSYEYVYMFAKTKKYFFNREPLNEAEQEDMWTITARPKANGLGTAAYPDELVERCLAIGCPPGGNVLDPFLGSGTTLRVAVSKGMDGIGIDLSKEFCEYAAKKLGMNNVPQP
jgi:DNA modification methylase